MTGCHLRIKQGQRKMKFGAMAKFRVGSSNMTFIFDIDAIFINYSQQLTGFYLRARQSQRKMTFCTIAIFGRVIL